MGARGARIAQGMMAGAAQGISLGLDIEKFRQDTQATKQRLEMERQSFELQKEEKQQEQKNFAVDHVHSYMGNYFNLVSKPESTKAGTAYLHSVQDPLSQLTVAADIKMDIPRMLEDADAWAGVAREFGELQKEARITAGLGKRWTPSQSQQEVLSRAINAPFGGYVDTWMKDMQEHNMKLIGYEQELAKRSTMTSKETEDLIKLDTDERKAVDLDVDVSRKGQALMAQLDTGKFKVGGIAGVMRQALMNDTLGKVSLGATRKMLSAEEVAFYRSTEEYFQTWRTAVTGAQAAMQELTYLRGVMPGQLDQEGQYRYTVKVAQLTAKLGRAEKVLNAVMRRPPELRQEMLKRNLTDPLEYEFAMALANGQPVRDIMLSQLPELQKETKAKEIEAGGLTIRLK